MNLRSINIKIILGITYLLIISIGLYFLFSAVDIKDLMSYEFIRSNQEIILKSTIAYYDLIYKTKSKEFNLANLSLLERQVESDRSRIQRGEISLIDLSQSESSLAGPKQVLLLQVMSF